MHALMTRHRLDGRMRWLGARLRWQALGFALGFLAAGSVTAWLLSSRLSG